MATVRYTLDIGTELTPEKEAAMRAEIRAAARRPYVYDPDCPLLTEAQLAQFRPVNFATMEERAEAMRKAGIVDPDTVKPRRPRSRPQGGPDGARPTGGPPGAAGRRRRGGSRWPA